MPQKGPSGQRVQGRQAAGAMPHANALHCLAFAQLAETRRLAPQVSGGGRPSGRSSQPRPRRGRPAQGRRLRRAARR
eukprot:10025673-Alexandrium_andersonii.AAC.1